MTTKAQPSLRSLNAAFDRHYASMVAWCRRRIRPDLGDPEEFVHQAYLRCRNRWKENLRSRHTDAKFLFQSLRWVVLDSLRSHRRRKAREAAQTPRPISDGRWAPARKLMAQEAVLSLSRRQRQVCLGILCGKSRQQIARELSLPDTAVAVHLSRAKGALCDRLELVV
jgi:RNA polymerase sigma factor (sigma-70 family)